MSNIYIYICGALIIVLLGIIVILFYIRINGKNHSSGSSKTSKGQERKEEMRRKNVSNQISQDIKSQLEKQRKGLDSLRSRLESKYCSTPKTDVNITRSSYPNYHSELTRLFDLNKDEVILYCRRYEKWLGSDTFFIITEHGIGYAPQRNVLPMIFFDEIKEFNAPNNDGYVKVILKNGEDCWIEAEDFTYDGTQNELARMLNNYLNGYQSTFDIYFYACCDALEEKATPLLPSLIEKIGEINRNWANFFRANYKFILCEDGIDIKDNIREAFYDVENILNLAGEDEKDDDIINACLVLKAKLKLVNEEDHVEIKKLLDTVLGNNCSQFVIDDANRVRRKLVL